MKRLMMTVLTGVCIAAAPVVVPAHPAQAVGLEFQCVGEATLHFSPGLTYTPKPVEVIYSSELTCPLAPLRVSSGRGQSLFTMPNASCMNLAAEPTTASLSWLPRATSSTIDYTTITINLFAPGQVTQTGVVTAGMAAGAQATSAIALSEVDLGKCDTAAGITYLTGLEELTIFS